MRLEGSKLKTNEGRINNLKTIDASTKNMFNNKARRNSLKPTETILNKLITNKLKGIKLSN